jgi:hypothetical protein
MLFFSSPALVYETSPLASLRAAKKYGFYVKENKGDLHDVGAGRCPRLTGPLLYSAFLKLLDELGITHSGVSGPWRNPESLRA